MTTCQAYTINVDTDRVARLDARVALFDLNTHPFYVAWSNGTLPAEKLRRYANDYAGFIGRIADGWTAAGEENYAEEERGHAIMWDHFVSDIGRTGAPVLPESAALIGQAKEAFGDAAEAIGALYAFESQQPRTAQAKLAGLQTHYRGLVGEKGTEYFRVHANDTAEARLLAEKIGQLKPGEYIRARAACAATAASMWRALDGFWQSA